MMDTRFQEQFEQFCEAQKRTASPRRLEMLNGDITGMIKLFQSALWPVFQTFDGFVAHADKITRDRHSFERSRVRTMVLKRCLYVPFSYDELDKRSHYCQSYVHELLGLCGWGTIGRGNSREGIMLDLYEREIVRHAIWLSRPIRLKDACECLGKKEQFSKKVVESSYQRNCSIQHDFRPSEFTNMYWSPPHIAISDTRCGIIPLRRCKPAGQAWSIEKAPKMGCRLVRQA